MLYATEHSREMESKRAHTQTGEKRELGKGVTEGKRGGRDNRVMRCDGPVAGASRGALERMTPSLREDDKTPEVVFLGSFLRASVKSV